MFEQIVKKLQAGIDARLFALIGAILASGRYSCAIDTVALENLETNIRESRSQFKTKYFSLPLVVRNLADQNKTTQTARITLTADIFEQMKRIGKETFYLNVDRNPTTGFNEYKFEAITDNSHPTPP